MGGTVIRTCDHCGADLMKFDAARGERDGQRYIRFQEAQRDLPRMTGFSSDRPLLRGVYCGVDCAVEALRGVAKPDA